MVVEFGSQRIGCLISRKSSSVPNQSPGGLGQDFGMSTSRRVRTALGMICVNTDLFRPAVVKNIPANLIGLTQVIGLSPIKRRLVMWDTAL